MFQGPRGTHTTNRSIRGKNKPIIKSISNDCGIIDNKDIKSKPRVENLGIKTYCCETLMTNLNKKRELAQFLVNLEN